MAKYTLKKVDYYDYDAPVSSFEFVINDKETDSIAYIGHREKKMKRCAVASDFSDELFGNINEVINGFECNEEDTAAFNKVLAEYMKEKGLLYDKKALDDGLALYVKEYYNNVTRYRESNLSKDLQNSIITWSLSRKSYFESYGYTLGEFGKSTTLWDRLKNIGKNYVKDQQVVNYMDKIPENLHGEILETFRVVAKVPEDKRLTLLDVLRDKDKENFEEFVRCNPDLKECLEAVKARYDGLGRIFKERVKQSSAMFDEATKDVVDFDGLLNIYKADIIEDKIRFDAYKRTGNVELLVPDAKQIAGKSFDELLAMYGPTSESRYTSAAIIMDAIKKEKEKGVDIVPLLNKFGEFLKYDKQEDRDYRPDGVRQSIFEAFMEMEGMSLNNFSNHKEEYEMFVLKLKSSKKYNGSELESENEARDVSIKEFGETLFPERIDRTKDKNEILKRIKARVEELNNEENLVFGGVVVDRVEAEINQEWKEYGMSPGDEARKKLVAKHKKPAKSSSQQNLIKAVEKRKRKEL